MSLVPAINAAVATVAKTAIQTFPDLCDVIMMVSSSDGFGGTTDTPTTMASGVKCFYEALTTPMQREVAGAGLVSLSHKLMVEATPATKVIKSDYQIVVAARNDKPVLTFERPVTLDGSYIAVVELAAVLAE